MQQISVQRGGRRILRVALVTALFAATPFPTRAAVQEPPTFSNPREFTNAFWPFEPGRVTVASNVRAPGDRELRRYLEDSTRIFAWRGALVQCAVLREESIEEGELVGSTEMYVAQSDGGAVYVFGELSEGEDDGEDDDDDWVVGGTLPNSSGKAMRLRDPLLLMPAAPRLGQSWQVETLPLGDEIATVVGVGQTIETSAGTFEGCIQVIEESLIEEDSEFKWYAPGAGWVQTAVEDEVVRLEVLASELGAVAVCVVYDPAGERAWLELAVAPFASLRSMTIRSPVGEVIANVGTPELRRYATLGQPGTSSIQLATPPLEMGLASTLYPSGRYRFSAVAADNGHELYAEFELDYGEPKRPVLLYPAAGERVPHVGLVVSWVRPREIERYRLTLRDADSGALLAVDVVAESDSFELPSWLRPGHSYELELRAIDAEGNAHIAALSFATRE